MDEEVKQLIDRLYAETRQLLEANRDKIEAIARALLKYETLDNQDIEQIMRGQQLTRPTVSELIEKEQKPARIQPIQPPQINPGLGGLGGGPLPAPG